MVNGEWWETENLLKSELDQRASLSADPKSDFGSYRMLLETSDFKKSLIKQHNELSPIHRTKLLRKLLGPKQIESVLGKEKVSIKIKSFDDLKDFLNHK